MVNSCGRCLPRKITSFFAPTRNHSRTVNKLNMIIIILFQSHVVITWLWFRIYYKLKYFKFNRIIIYDVLRENDLKYEGSVENESSCIVWWSVPLYKGIQLTTFHLKYLHVATSGNFGFVIKVGKLWNTTDAGRAGSALLFLNVSEKLN
jgi:hypothetical protein